MRHRAIPRPPRALAPTHAALLVLAALAGACGVGDRNEEPEVAHDRARSQAAEATPQARVAATVGDWCVEHGLPESKCTKCDPSLVAKFKAAGDFCAEHGFPESACPVCHPQAPPAGAEVQALEARIVRFRSPEIERQVGIETAKARRGTAARGVQCTARIAFDSNRVADVRALVPGIVRRVRAELGEQVKRGTPLFDLESTRVGDVQAALLTAREELRTAEAHLERQRALREREIASARQVEEAERDAARARGEVRAAEATLRMAGASGAGRAGVYTLRAPLGGTVVRRPAVVGLLATERDSLATVADTSVMWALCAVPEQQAHRIRLGQRVRVSTEGAPPDAEPLEGEVTWIAAEVDPRTRTVTARAEVNNPEGRLRANQFASARLETEAKGKGVSVPREAVQRVGEREVVFVRRAAGEYHPKVVRRLDGGEWVAVQGDVQAGDSVVTTGAVLLRTEIVPGSIGAGCCEVEPAGGE